MRTLSPVRRLLGAAALLLLLIPNSSVNPLTAAGVPADIPEMGTQTVASGFVLPTFMTYAPDGSGRLFITEQRGVIRVLKNGDLLPQPFLDISSKVTFSAERGLFSMAFAPDYAASGVFYLYYMTGDTPDVVLARYHVSTNPNVADPATEQILLRLPEAGSAHNGGLIAFGPDGYLYLATGDGSDGADPDDRAQNLSSLYGKMLRLDVSDTSKDGYGIPPSNPFQNLGNDDKAEIWASGLRNPWRFSFDRATGRLFIADVGEKNFEEINVQAPGIGGENYGWRVWEGDTCWETARCDSTYFSPPAAQYNHDNGNCAIMGGYVYRGSEFPRMAGRYFYADLCSRELSMLREVNGKWESQVLATLPFQTESFGEDQDANLYILDYPGGRLLKLIDTRGPLHQTFLPVSTLDTNDQR